MKSYQCMACIYIRAKSFILKSLFIHKPGVCFIYHEEEGQPEDGIAVGTIWKDLPDDWECPVCSATKDMFDMVEL